MKLEKFAIGFASIYENIYTNYIEYCQGISNQFNILWVIVILFGSVGFLSVGTFSYTLDKQNLYSPIAIHYFPQGIFLTFYGVLGLLIGLLLMRLNQQNYGFGENVFDLKNKNIYLIRKQYVSVTSIFNPSQLSFNNLYIKYQFQDIKRLVISLESSQQFVLYLSLKDGRFIPLNTQLFQRQELEKTIYLLSQILNLPADFIYKV
jgi:hypothetical protein